MNDMQVLDHGFVHLVDHMGDDLSIVRAARLSYNEAWRAGESEGSDFRLLNYLWKNKHTTPFEAVEFQFEISAPIFIMRQWSRHRTWRFWTFNEVSARYKKVEPQFYTPDILTIGLQSSVNKQGRVIGEEPPEGWGWLKNDLCNYRSHCKAAFQVYEDLLGRGWPREVARGVLPLSTYTHVAAKVDLLNLFHFLTLRNDPHAQFEIQLYAQAIQEVIKPIVPISLSIFQSTNA